MIASAGQDARVGAALPQKRSSPVEIKAVAQSVAFSEEKMQKNALFDSPHLFYDAYCLLPGQPRKSTPTKARTRSITSFGAPAASPSATRSGT
jgi:hypothetical protein